MLKPKKRKYGRHLMPAVLIYLCSCTTINYDNCPSYPIAGKSVASELENLSYSDFPNTWEWLGRINKLRQELELCKK